VDFSAEFAFLFSFAPDISPAVVGFSNVVIVWVAKNFAHDRRSCRCLSSTPCMYAFDSHWFRGVIILVPRELEHAKAFSSLRMLLGLLNVVLFFVGTMGMTLAISNTTCPSLDS
jgi:hypothetical protein